MKDTTAHTASDLLSWLDRAGWRPVHTFITLALGIGWLLDAFEVNLIGNVLNLIEKVWHLTAQQGSYLVSLWLVGMTVGALCFGYLADRFGRRRLFVFTVLMYAFFTLLTALSPNFQSLLVLRFLTALGVGAEYTAVNACLTELIPSSHRGRIGGLVINFWSLGAILSSVLTLVVLSLLPPAIAWRVGFGLGAIVAIFAGYFRRWIPESPRWLLARGRVSEARQVVSSMTGRKDLPEGAAIAPPIPTRQALGRSVGPLVVGTLLAISLGLGFYGLFAVVPLVILPAAHITGAGVSWFLIRGDIGALAGGLLMSWWLDRIGRKPTITLFYALAVIGVFIFGLTVQSRAPSLISLGFIVAEFCITGAWTASYPFSTELFPTAARGTGLGMAVAVGRLAAAFSPIVAVSVMQHAGVRSGFLLLSGFWLIGLLTMVGFWIFGPEPAGKPLEEFEAAVA